MTSACTLTLDGLQELIDTLSGRGYTVVGPTVADGAIDFRAVTAVGDLPRGLGDEQDAATYRLRRRDDEAVFAFACGPQSAKPVLVTGFFILASHTCPVAQSRKPNRCRF